MTLVRREVDRLPVSEILTHLAYGRRVVVLAELRGVVRDAFRACREAVTEADPSLMRHSLRLTNGQETIYSHPRNGRIDFLDGCDLGRYRCVFDVAVVIGRDLSDDHLLELAMCDGGDAQLIHVSDLGCARDAG